MDNNYRILKLRNGESVIAGLKADTQDNIIVLERPMLFRIMSVMDHKTMGMRDYLLIRNWAEYSIDKTVEIRKDEVIAILTPDEKISVVYEFEKQKEDAPETPPSEMLGLVPLVNETRPNELQMLNIQLQLQPEASEQFLEMLGIEMDEKGQIRDIQDEEEDEDDDVDMEDDLWEEEKQMAKPINNPNFVNGDESSPPFISFGNSPNDWSPDPSDYLK